MLLIEADRERYSDEGKPPVAWEHYLEVAPGLAALDPQVRPDALAERELDRDAWTRAESYWVLTFALDLQHGRTDRVDAFGRACAEALAGRDPAQLMTGEAPEVHVELPPASEREVPPRPVPPRPVPPVELPSFLKAAETAVAPALLAAPAPLPVAAMTPPPLAPLAPPGPVAPALVAASAPTFKGTIDVVPADLVPALPFGGAPSPDYMARLATAAPAPPAAPARSDRPGATVMDLNPAKLLSLPFPGARTPAVAPVPAASAALASSATPPQQPLTAPDLPLEQHAMLSAELSMLRDGPSRAAALFRYGVDGIAALTALGARWKERLQADPAAAARWKAVYTEHQKGHAQKPR